MMRATNLSTLLVIMQIMGFQMVYAAQPVGAATASEDLRPQHRMGEGEGHGGHHISLGPSGSVMNSNTSQLPRDCTEIGAEQTFTVYAGVEFAADYPGSTYGMSQHEYLVEPCSLVTVTFVNKDQVRHQWMIHGLPKYLYKQGMFHLEAAGGFSQTGSFIVPSDDRTYLVHCDVPQHMEKGMKGQLKVGRGDGDLWSVPGVSDGLYRDSYTPHYAGILFMMSMAVGIALVCVLYGISGRE
ncbi:MAG: hypothetical protein O7E57_05260 [Gammaproteobacteria bacterium]|nr:hypothetical protein [Gammaproteobacteria bacterium]